MSARIENIENHVKFNTGAINIMSNDLKNIKSIVEEMNVCCNEINKITN